MNKELKGLYPQILSQYQSEEVFDAHDFICKFQRNYMTVYNDYLVHYGMTFLHSRLAWILSKYHDELGVIKIGHDAKSNTSVWRKL